MTPEKLQFFKEHLITRLNSLIEEANRSVGEFAEEQIMPPDAIDWATEESWRDQSIRLRDRERKLMYKIREALQRIEEREYGVCEVCGEDISEKRLIARPVTTHCIDCKTEMETQERIRGM
ncbi:RNA polymerase-binding protein DksA [Myxococcota bacterium]|nr:RNA polymerase-binding protein DksA [Myxococcota bacterium]